MAFDTSLGFAATVLGRGPDFVRLGDASRFQRTAVYGAGTDLHFGRWRQPDDMLASGVYTELEIPPGADRRPDLVAFMAYGDTSLWWAICFANQIDNVLRDFRSGMTIKVPSKQSLLQYLSSEG